MLDKIKKYRNYIILSAAVLIMVATVSSDTFQEAANSFLYANQTGSGVGAYVYMNYTFINTTTSLNWQVQHSDQAAYNITLNAADTCFINANTTGVFQGRGYSVSTTSASNSWWECYNGTTWNFVGNNYSSSGTAVGCTYTAQVPPSNYNDSSYSTYNSYCRLTCTGWKSSISCISGGSAFTAARLYEESMYFMGTITNSCSYTSGNWLVQCGDGCNLTSNVNLLKNNITFNGTGFVNITANITNVTNTIIQNGCVVRCSNGGCVQK